jgi:hypothetical protein
MDTSKAHDLLREILLALCQYVLSRMVLLMLILFGCQEDHENESFKMRAVNIGRGNAVLLQHKMAHRIAQVGTN